MTHQLPHCHACNNTGRCKLESKTEHISESGHKYWDMGMTWSCKCPAGKRMERLFKTDFDRFLHETEKLE